MRLKRHFNGILTEISDDDSQVVRFIPGLQRQMVVIIASVSHFIRSLQGEKNAISRRFPAAY